MITNSQQDLDSLRLKELQQRFREVVGEETRCPNRTFLTRRILAAAAAPPAPTLPLESAPALVEQAPAPAVEAPPPEREEEEPIAPPEQESPPPARDAAPANDPPATALEPWVPSEAEVEAMAAESSAEPTQRARRGRFSAMTVEQLQTLYVAKVGRTTGSTDRRYLEWKIREAEKGRIPIGPREARAAEHEGTSDVRILPLRLEVTAVDALDAAWRAKGMKSRMELFRRALGHYLAHIGADGAAAHFAAPHAT
jgi:hypothetical protein